jgi:hypothetical protein
MSSEEAAKSDTLATGQAQVNPAVYSDANILKKFSALPDLAEVDRDRKTPRTVPCRVRFPSDVARTDTRKQRSF